MIYTNSPLVTFIQPSPNHSGLRTYSIDRITPHCASEEFTVERFGERFSHPEIEASSNYGIGPDGRIGMYVEECNRSWCSSDRENDQRAVTIECSSGDRDPYIFPDVVYRTLILLCTDICRRNGKKKLLWTGDRERTLAYDPAPEEMILTVHRWFTDKSCPGPWMLAHMDELARQVTVRLS